MDDNKREQIYARWRKIAKKVEEKSGPLTRQELMEFLGAGLDVVFGDEYEKYGINRFLDDEEGDENE